MPFSLKLAAFGALLIPCALAHADQMQQFNLSATTVAFESHPGGSLSASMLLNTTTGIMTSMSVTFTDFTGTYTSGALNPLTNPGGVVEITETGLPNLELILPVSTLAGYTGGSVCTVAHPCGTFLNLASFVTVPNAEGYLTARAVASGAVTPAAVTATTPEPSSLALAATGLAGLWGSIRSSTARSRRARRA